MRTNLIKVRSAGEAAGVLAQCPHRGTKRGGLVTLAGRAQFTGQAAARALQGLPGPLDDVERVQADQRLRRLLADHAVDPVRAVDGHVRQQPRPLLAEVSEELAQGLLVPEGTAISSGTPITRLRTPSSRSFPPRSPVTTRSTTDCSVRQVTRSNFAAFVQT
jgi:hypothetical protein